MLFAMDCPSVLDPLCKISADDDPHGVENNTVDRYGAAVKCVDRIFVQRGHRPCIEDDVLRWPYAGCNIVTASAREKLSQPDKKGPIWEAKVKKAIRLL